MIIKYLSILIFVLIQQLGLSCKDGKITFLNNSFAEKPKVEGKNILLPDGRIIETTLTNLKFLEIIKEPVSIKYYFILSGRDCEDCDSPISIYIHSPSDGNLLVYNGEDHYKHPGKESSMEDNVLIYESRMFAGEIFQNKYGAVWYENVLGTDKKIHKRVFIVEVKNGKLKEAMIEENLPDIKETLDLLKKGSCTEIPGLDYLEQP